MMRGLMTAATGLEAQQANIERISNDLANVNTDGYKRGRIEFQDLMYQTIKEPGGQLGAGSQTPVGIQQGTGVKVGASYKMFEPGSPRVTNSPFDMMIEGDGFFTVQLPNGESAFTRSGAFHLDSQGKMVLTNGAVLNPPINIPQNAGKVTINPTGEVRTFIAGEGEIMLGQVQVASFQNPQGLTAHGSGIFKATPASGQAVIGIPGENGSGTIFQGAIEGSNVNIANSMVDMISTQRAYEMGTKVMSVADQMLGATANIK